MTSGMVVLAALAVLLIAVFPFWPYAARWGYYPVFGVSVVMMIVIVLMLVGRV